MRVNHAGERRALVYGATPAVYAAIRLVVLIAVVIIGAGGEVRAQSGALKNNPVEVVKRYLALDSKGARLSSTTYEALSPFVDWGPDHVWGKIMVITDFTIAEDISEWEVVDNLEVVIPVTFTVLGSVYYETSGFVADPAKERIQVRVKAVRNRWRIVGPIWPPHVGQKRMINQVRQAWLDETDLSKRRQLASLQEALEKAK
ncbi:hypothetical protein YTPLAS18_38010 [Nitrospira sp.]|nr:hypothetical protein YTPLAS18_38010 [Nitrospira sp.]